MEEIAEKLGLLTADAVSKKSHRCARSILGSSNHWQLAEAVLQKLLIKSGWWKSSTFWSSTSRNGIPYVTRLVVCSFRRVQSARSDSTQLNCQLSWVGSGALNAP